MWYINLSFNEITEIMANTSKGATKLKKIRISNNLLRTISSGVFSSNRQVEHASFSHDQISGIDSLAFAYETQLDTID